MVSQPPSDGRDWNLAWTLRAPELGLVEGVSSVSTGDTEIKATS